MPNTKGSKRGEYEKTCYFAKIFHKEWKDTFDETKENAYPFAIEYKDTLAFFAEYEQNSDRYEFLDRFLLPSDRLTAEQLHREQKNNHKSFCSRCKTRDSYEYQNCFCKAYVAQEYLFDISIMDRGKRSFCCPKCHRSYFLQPGRDPQISFLQDTRFLGKPAVLLVRRDYPKCPSCNIRVGEEMVVGFQAYCDGTLTCRLAESILFAQLSMIKREYIAEAYGVSKSQIDRIKQRMLEQSRKIKQQRIKWQIAEHLQSQVVQKEFKDSRTGHVYVCYFLKRSESRYDLILIFTQAERDALSKVKSDPEEFSRHFSDAISFYFACFCCLASERGLRGEELEKTLADMERSYYDVFPQQDSTEWEATVSYQSINRSLELPKKDPLHLLWRTGTGFTPDDIQIEENGQYVFAEFSAKQRSGSRGDSDNIDEIDAFIALLREVLGKHRTSSAAVKEALLNFNPAVITEVEMAVQTGMRYPDLDWHTLQTEGIYMAIPPFGAPLPCLTHFLKSGLFDPKNETLFPCTLSHEIRYSKDGSVLLPCGIPGKFCPHLQT